MKRNFLTAVWFTLVTTLLLGVLYPLAITGLSQMLFPKQANGQLIERNGKLVGSAIWPRLFSLAPVKCRDGL
jgi:potassium-transporting ATPase KdpC subunit